MSPALDPGALLARYYALPNGPRVCLRLARPRDQAGIRELFDAHGQPLDELELVRLVSLDLTRRLVLVATALIATSEKVVGVGSIGLGEQASGEPTLVLVDDDRTEGLDGLLADALIGHASAIARVRAA
ncbi:MAG TPA: hypothetical protein VG325_09575 [Solirubrobacteraceae bacterium]|jgi:hypothetical protein|nr:hypothetical protein [Solirubrobacteraceae bacterium]